MAEQLPYCKCNVWVGLLSLNYLCMCYVLMVVLFWEFWKCDWKVYSFVPHYLHFMSCSHYSRDQIFMGFQWTAQLPTAGCSSFHFSEDGKLVHSQSWSIGCRELYMRSEKHDDQLNSVQLSNPSGGTEGRWASPSPVCLVVISLWDKSLVLSAIVVLLLCQSDLFFHHLKISKLLVTYTTALAFLLLFKWYDLLLPCAVVMGEYEPKIEVQFPDTLHVSKGSSVKLECFALGK